MNLDTRLRHHEELKVWPSFYNFVQFVPILSKCDQVLLKWREICDTEGKSWFPVSQSGQSWPLTRFAAEEKGAHIPHHLILHQKLQLDQTIRRNIAQQMIWLHLSAFPIISWSYLQIMIAIIMIVQIHPCWCPQWQYSGWNEAWKDSKGGAGRHWCSMQTVDLCPYIMHYRAGLFPWITRIDYSPRLFHPGLFTYIVFAGLFPYIIGLDSSQYNGCHTIFGWIP